MGQIPLLFRIPMFPDALSVLQLAKVRVCVNVNILVS